MLAQNQCGRSLHSLHIKCCIQCVKITGLPGRTNLSAKNSIFIRFCLRAMPRMEIAAGPRCAEHADRGRECAVERAGEIRLRNRCRQRKRCHLGKGVHACIRAACALGQHVFAGDSGQCIAQFALHRHPVGLHLPAVEVGTVIGKHHLPHKRISLHFSPGAGDHPCDILAKSVERIAHEDRN